MPNVVVTLIERAMQSSDDRERLACLDQAKKIYRGQGELVLPRVEKSTKTQEQPDAITLEEHEKKVAEINHQNAKTNREKQQALNDLSVLEQKLEKSEQEKEQIKKDSERTLRNIKIQIFAGWAILATIVFFVATL